MMKDSKKIIAGAIASVLALAAGAAQAQPNVQCAAVERCYGISKAGKNDCATATSACSGTAKQDYQKDAWVYIPKGTCDKIAGSSLKPTAKN